MTNQDNAVGVMKVLSMHEGLYVRLPSKAVKITGYRKGDKVAVYVSTDKTTIKLVKRLDDSDIINLDEPATELQHIPVEQAGPAARHRLSELIQRITGK
jgi:tRNA threonylcarbamoyladenosine modification (KEOPS) complex Cgi121 subunit